MRRYFNLPGIQSDQQQAVARMDGEIGRLEGQIRMLLASIQRESSRPPKEINWGAIAGWQGQISALTARISQIKSTISVTNSRIGRLVEDLARANYKYSGLGEQNQDRMRETKSKIDQIRGALPRNFELNNQKMPTVDRNLRPSKMPYVGKGKTPMIGIRPDDKFNLVPPNSSSHSLSDRVKNITQKMKERAGLTLQKQFGGNTVGIPVINYQKLSAAEVATPQGAMTLAELISWIMGIGIVDGPLPVGDIIAAIGLAALIILLTVGVVVVTADGTVAVGQEGKGETAGEDELVFGGLSKGKRKLEGEMGRRGWTEEDVIDTVENPYTTRPSTNKATDEPATAYYNEDGSYVVVEDGTNEVIQVSKKGDSEWAPDGAIQDPYFP